jgi:hypothetical protein
VQHQCNQDHRQNHGQTARCWVHDRVPPVSPARLPLRRRTCASISRRYRRAGMTALA